MLADPLLTGLLHGAKLSNTTDLRPEPTSSTIGKGVPTMWTEDFDGTEVTLRSHPDIGAFQHNPKQARALPSKTDDTQADKQELDWSAFLSRAGPINDFHVSHPMTTPDEWLEASLAGNAMLGTQVLVCPGGVCHQSLHTGSNRRLPSPADAPLQIVLPVTRGDVSDIRSGNDSTGTVTCAGSPLWSQPKLGIGALVQRPTRDAIVSPPSPPAPSPLPPLPPCPASGCTGCGGCKWPSANATLPEPKQTVSGSLTGATTLACEAKCGSMVPACAGFTRKDVEADCYFYSKAQVSGVFSHERPDVFWHPNPKAASMHRVPVKADDVNMVLRLSLLLLPAVDGYAADTVLPHHMPQRCNCSTWTNWTTTSGVNESFAASLWASSEAMHTAGAACAFPANAVTPLPNASTAHLTGDGWCLCDGSSRWDDKSWTWCNPPPAAPSQINLLVIDATAVACSFVTADEGRTASAVPVAEFRVVGSSSVAVNTLGFSTLYTDPGFKRRLSYHAVTLTGLRERTEYEYRVQSGAAGSSVWSAWKIFRSLYSTGATRLAMYGDMGVFPATRQSRTLPVPARNNIGNLIDDAAAGRIDWVVHSGDHAYEFEEFPTTPWGSRGDGYMDSYEALLAHVPWAPGFGNHEYLRGDKANRLLNITAGLVAGLANSTKGPLPMTAQWYSVNIGLLHLVHLDFSPYFCNFTDCCGHKGNCGFTEEWSCDFRGYRDAILAWARQDLAGVDRAATPWTIVSTHFPLYDTMLGDTARDDSLSVDWKPLGRGGLSSDGPVATKAQALLDLEPLMLEHKVAVYFAGHNHNYETTWPVARNRTVQRNYSDPQGPIHITSGCGGPRDYDRFGEAKDWTREPRFNNASYSRVRMDSHTMWWEQVSNIDGQILDAFNITRTSHSAKVAKTDDSDMLEQFPAKADDGNVALTRRAMLPRSAVVHVLKTDDDTPRVATNLPILRWASTIPSAINASAFRITVRKADHDHPQQHWDSSWLWRENPHQENATWPASATTYAGPALRPTTTYEWSVREQYIYHGEGSLRITTAAVAGGVFLTSTALPTAIDEARSSLNSSAIRRLRQGQLKNLLARVGSDGYLSTSVYGGYTGLYTRDTSAFVLAMVQIGDAAALAAGGAALKYMLRTFTRPGLKDHTTDEVISLDRAPHCTWAWNKHDAPLDFCPTFASSSCVSGRNCTCFAKGNFSSQPFHDQVDGNAHLLIAFHRWCEAAGAEGAKLAVQYYPLMKRFLSTYVGDGTHDAAGPYVNASLGLIWNPGFEGPGSSSYNLLTNSFVAEALRVMAVRAMTLKDHVVAAHYQRIETMLRAGIEENLTMSLDGETVYAMFRSHGGDAKLDTGLSWANLGPIPAVMGSDSSGGFNRTRMEATVAAMWRHASFEWGEPKVVEGDSGRLPVAVSLSQVSADHTGADFAVIGKGLGWELGWAAATKDWQRITALYRWLDAVAGDVPVHCKAAPCSPTSSEMLGESYFYDRYLADQWYMYFADLGNAEQASWWLWGTDLVQKALSTHADEASVTFRPPATKFDDGQVGTCSTDLNCSLNGVCTGVVCVCDKPWSGVSCGVLAYDVTPASAKSIHPINTSFHSWGGPVTKAAGRYHMYLAVGLKRALFGLDRQTSMLHGISQTAEGPYDWHSTIPLRSGENNPGLATFSNAFDVRQPDHCGNSTLSAHRFSIDGRRWHVLDSPVEPYGHTVHYDDGSEHTYTTLERLFIVFNKAREATHISLAADMDTGDEGCVANLSVNPYNACTNCKYLLRECVYLTKATMST